MPLFTASAGSDPLQQALRIALAVALLCLPPLIAAYTTR